MKYRWFIISSIFIVLNCFSIGYAQDDLPSLLEKAQQGDAWAQCSLGWHYRVGRGVSRDYKEAAKWYRMAADQNDANAQFNLGCLYFFGNGVEQNYTEAMRFYQFAADQGYVEAQYNLGICYGEGTGGEKNETESMRWFRRAAEQGFSEAQLILGGKYYDGDGVPQNYEEAIKWFLLAANQDVEIAQYNLGQCYKEGKGVSESDVEAAKWYRLASENGLAIAQNALSSCYYTGAGVLEDYAEAYAWCSIAAMKGNNDAVKNKSLLKDRLASRQIAAGQERAKELMAIIERKKQVAKLPAGQVPSADISPSGFGSGLLVKGGYVVTCWHVVENSKKISINCQGKDFNASLVQKDEGNDIAILHVDGADAGASLSFSDSVKLGAQVFTMGFPHPDLQGSDVKFTTGSISGLSGPGNTPVYYQISAPLQSGNSGGPLFDEYGNLVGIVAAKLDSLKMLAATGDLTQNVNYAIKSDYLVPLLKTVDGIKIQPPQTKPVNLLSLVEELKKSVVMIKVY
jgi:TPR repeat protein